MGGEMGATPASQPGSHQCTLLTAPLTLPSPLSPIFPPTPSRPRLPADEKHGNGADTYLHRVGRAGRFGTKGLAITFVASPADSEVLNQVQVSSRSRSRAGMSSD